MNEGVDTVKIIIILNFKKLKINIRKVVKYSMTQV